MGSAHALPVVRITRKKSMDKLLSIAPDIWHLERRFSVGGVALSSRMTVVRLHDGRLWLHSPVALTKADVTELEALGPVAFIVAPNKMHYLFAVACAATFHDAKVYGAPGLAEKRPEFRGMIALNDPESIIWKEELDECFVDGMPMLNETVWLHRASRTLIATDLLQWWRGDMNLGSRIIANVTGVRKHLNVPRTIRSMVRDRAATKQSIDTILGWPFERVITAHNTIVANGEHGVADVHAVVKQAFQFVLK